MTDQNVSLPPFGPLHSDAHQTSQMLQQREVQLRRAMHENAALWDELAAAKHDAQHTRSLIAEMLYLQERIEKLDARIAVMVKALGEILIDFHSAEEMRTIARTAIANAQQLRKYPDKEVEK